MAVPGVLRVRTVYSGAAGMLCQQLGRSALQCQIPARAVGREAGQAPPPSSPLWGSRGMQDGGGFPPCWVSVAELGVLGFGGAPQGFRGANTAQTPAGTLFLCWPGKGSLSQPKVLWCLLPQQQEDFSPSHVEKHLLLPSHSSFCRAQSLACTSKFPRLPGLSIPPLHVALGNCISFLFISL